jgi:acetyltransferase
MKTLTEKEAEDFLEKKGFKVVKRALIKNKEQIKELKEKLKFPWVMKISSRHIVHKAKIGGTILNIKNQKQAEKAFDKLKSINSFEGILIQEMQSGEELILGIKNTEEFGNVIMLGKGGSNVEEEKDISFRVPPIKEKEAEKMLKELKVYNKIKNKINQEQIIKALLKLSKLAEKQKNIKELDINPMIINKTQTIAVDARAVLN